MRDRVRPFLRSPPCCIADRDAATAYWALQGDQDLHDFERLPSTGRFLAGRLRHALTTDETRQLEDLVSEVKTLPAGTVLMARGQVCDTSTILIAGFALRVVQADQRRFVVGLQVPGDFIDLHAFALKRLDHDLVACGDVTVGCVPHDRLERLMETSPHLARILWFSTLLDAAIHREWIMKLEQLPTPRRVAHIYAEIWARLDFVGLGRAGVVRTPMTQADLADMAGSSPVHMSRALAQLRAEGLGDYRRGDLYVPDRAALHRFASFDPAYLYAGELGVGHELDA